MKKMEKVESVIIHCTNSDLMSDDNIEKIRLLHTAPKCTPVKFGGGKIYGFSWDDVAYHYFIQKSGRVEFGRSEYYQGAHTYGHNSNSIGICVSGKDNFTLAQFRTLLNLIERCKLQYGLKDENIRGHYEFSENKTCPNFLVNL